MVDDILRRSAAQTFAQQMSDVVEVATVHQCALSIARVLQTVTEDNRRTTVLSIDDIGAFDSISRKSMGEAEMREKGGPRHHAWVGWKTVSEVYSSVAIIGDETLLQSLCL